jgi:hypothetical protein
MSFRLLEKLRADWISIIYSCPHPVRKSVELYDIASKISLFDRVQEIFLDENVSILLRNSAAPHKLGFFKLVLLGAATPERIRAPTWMAPAVVLHWWPSRSGDTDIHEHPWNAVSFVLKGSIHNQLFDLAGC